MEGAQEEDGARQERRCELPEDCFAKTGKSYLVSVNILLAIMGLCLCAGGAYLWIEYERQFALVVSTGPILGVLVLGFVLFVLTMVGIYGTLTGSKRLLIGYLVVVVLLISVEVAVSILFLQYLRYVNASSAAPSGSLSDATEIYINNFVYRSYMTCCVDNPALCGGFPSAQDPKYCEPVPFCANATAAAQSCIVDKSATPSTKQEIGVCTAFKKFTLDGVALVDKAEAGNDLSCGGGVPLKFEQAVTTWLQSNVHFFGYGALVLGLLQLFIVAFTLGLLLANPTMIPKAEVVSEEDLAYDPRPLSLAVPIPANRPSSTRNTNRISLRSAGSAGGAPSPAEPGDVDAGDDVRDDRPTSISQRPLSVAQQRPLSVAQQRPVSQRQRPLSQRPLAPV
jgi:hypothetical protein